MPLLGQEPGPQSVSVYLHGRTGVQPPEKSEKKALKNNLKKKRHVAGLHSYKTDEPCSNGRGQGEPGGGDIRLVVGGQRDGGNHQRVR